jgi:hypothetical protein
MHASRQLAAIVAAAAIALGTAAPAAATLPTTPTVDHDKDPYAREMTLIFYAIPNPDGNRTVWITCDGGTTTSERYPFASRILVSLDLPGCEGYGLKEVDVQVEEADGTPVFFGHVSPGISARMTIGMPLPAITGHAFTFAPAYPADYRLPAGSVCRYEFRWGDDASLLRNEHNETFGALGFDANAVDGNCPRWTFTLPWVPYRQFELHLSVGVIEGNESSWGDSYHVMFDAAQDGTERRIGTSNLPIAQVLPSTYTPIVGQPVTYTRYLIGGASAGSSSTWNAWQGADPDLNHWHQSGGATFTIRPWEPGDVTVGWQRGGERLFYAMYDPPVRYPDRTRPATTPPIARLHVGQVGATVPIVLSWTGSDRGWGVRSFQLERSLDGGAWKRILTAKVKSSVQAVVPGHAYRYRVRAVDKAGNVGYWDYGPTFRPSVSEDTSASVTYAGTWALADDAAARRGSLREAVDPGSSATYRFTGRDVTWLAESGPGHGRATVFVDGTLAATVDLNGTVDTPARIVFRRHWAARGTHVVRIVVEATAGRPIVGVDGFAILR